MTLAVTVHDRQFLIILDGWYGTSSGLDRLDDKRGYDNKTTYSGRVLFQFVRSKIVYRVTKDRIRVKVNDKTIIDWKGDFNRLSMSPDQPVLDEEISHLFAYTKFRIHEIKLTPLSGKGEIWYPKAKPPASTKPAPVYVRLPNGWTIGPPRNLGPVVNSTQYDSTPALSADGLTLIFKSSRPGGHSLIDLWECHRDSRTDAWGPAKNLGATVNSSAYDSSPSLSEDGKTLVFVSKRPGGLGEYDFWMATRKSTADPWGKPVHMGASLNSAADEGGPAFLNGGRTLVFDSNRAGSGGGYDLWQSRRKGKAGAWTKPVNLGPPVNSPFNDKGPTVSADGRTLIFHSNRPNWLGDNDLWVSTRAVTGDAWGVPVPLGAPLNGPADDTSPHLSRDGRTLIFTSDRPGGAGDFDLYEATLFPPSAPGDHALSFDGKDDYVEIPTLMYDGSHPITIEAFVKPSEFETEREIASFRGSTGIQVNRDGIVGIGVITGSAVSARPIQLAKVVHLAGVYDGKQLSLFVDGRRQTPGEPLRASPNASLAPFLIGAEVKQSGSGNWQFFHGIIDEVRISKVARYTEDFTPAKRFTPDKDTLALYHFDEGSGDVLKDSSGNGHHGKIHGATWINADGSAIKPVKKDRVRYVRLPNGWTVGPPRNLGAVVNSAEEDRGPVLSADGLTLVFFSQRLGGQGGWDLWECRRSSRSAAWGPAKNLGATVNSSADDVSPNLSDDGKTLVFGSTRPGGLGDHDLWMATRKSTTDPWSKPVHMGASLNSAHKDYGPAFLDGGRTLLFHSNRPGGAGSSDLWQSRRTGNEGAWTKPVNLGPPVNTPFIEGGPTVSADGRTLIFNSDRPNGLGSADLWVSTRAANGDPWDAPVPLGAPLNSPYGDHWPHISADGRTLIFSSGRPGGAGQGDLYEATLFPPSAPGDHALSFDGKDDYVEIPTLKYDGSHPITLEARVTQFSTSPGGTVVGDAEGAGVILNLMDSSDTGSRRETVCFGVRQQGSYVIPASTTPVQLRRSIHIAGVFDGSQATLFIDGKEVQSLRLTKPFTPSTFSFMLGANPSAVTTFEHPFHGIIDEVRISKTARYTQDFIPAKRFTPDKDTLALYHFDEGQGDKLIDSSGNGHHGKIHGATWVNADGTPINPESK